MKKTTAILKMAVMLLIMGLSQAITAQTFVHPGLMSNKADLDLVKNNQTIEPWKSALTALKATSSASLTYAMQGPFASITRGTVNTGWTQHGNDAQACYVQALLWYITGNSTYATNAINIINSWSSTLTSVGGTDGELLVGIQGPLWAMAGEILANSGASSGWASADITRAKNMLTNLFLPFIAGFDPSDGANFSNSCVFAQMAIAVFTDNQAKFDEAWTAFTSTAGCPNDFSLLKNIASNGQNVESGRDQIHSWSSYEMLSGTAEIAYHQGKDPYTLGSNLLMTGVEYWCKYNLGGTVPWDASVYRCRAGWGPWSEISIINRGVPTGQGAVVNMVYRAYKRMGLEATYTKQMMAAMGNVMVPPQGGNGWGNPYIADALLFNILAAAPVITSATTANGTVGTAFSYTITATNTPTSYNATGLPAGLSVNTSTGVISGTPTTAGTSSVSLSATNASGTGTVTLTLTVSSTSTLSGTYTIVAQNSNKAVDVNGASTANGAAVIQYTNFVSTNQQWVITQISGNDYKVINLNSGKAMDVIGNSTAQGAKIEQRTYSGTDNSQKWTITNNGDGTCKIIGKASGKSLDVTNGSTANNTLMEIWPYNGGTNQKFILTIITTLKSAPADLKPEDQSSDIVFYPNPVTNELTISATVSKGAKAELYNISGELISSKFFEGTQVSIEMSGVPSGVYIVKVIDGQKIISRKIMKK